MAVNRVLAGFGGNFNRGFEAVPTESPCDARQQNTVEDRYENMLGLHDNGDGPLYGPCEKTDRCRSTLLNTWSAGHWPRLRARRRSSMAPTATRSPTSSATRSAARPC